jgi:hypothetical protein
VQSRGNKEASRERYYTVPLRSLEREGMERDKKKKEEEENRNNPRGKKESLTPPPSSRFFSFYSLVLHTTTTRALRAFNQRFFSFVCNLCVFCTHTHDFYYYLLLELLRM